VNAAFDKRGEIGRIRARGDWTKEARDDAVSAFTRRLRAIKTDLLNVTGRALPSVVEDAAWVREHRAIVLPDKQAFSKNRVAYDIQCHPQDYLLPMLRMTRFLEASGMKLRNVVPLRTSVVPMHITLDTLTLVRLLFDTGVFDDLDMCKSDLITHYAPRTRTIFGAASSAPTDASSTRRPTTRSTTRSRRTACRAASRTSTGAR
jgi:hypothetical protein